jgi:hypothetical protein
LQTGAQNTPITSSNDGVRAPAFPPDFLTSYFDAREAIEGWFTPDAALLFLLCNQLIRDRGIAGDVLEIGVHHGLSAIVTASLREAHGSFVAVDLFDDLQELNTSGSGAGSRSTFMTNMRSAFGNLDFMNVVTGSSEQLSPEQLGTNFAFCHVDGGHSARETYSDIVLCQQLLLPGGLLALDDYFNQEWPGVSEGALRYLLEHTEAFTTIAIGFNKVLLQKNPASLDLGLYLRQQAPDVPRKLVDFCGSPVVVISGALMPAFDLAKSDPEMLVPSALPPVTLRLYSDVRSLTASSGEALRVPLQVFNDANEALTERGRFGVSYHLLSSDGDVIRWDNPRTYITRQLLPQAQYETHIRVDAPATPAPYVVELDIVWEGVAWLSQRGLRTIAIDLVVDDSK